jgi:hypothetical protein
MPAPRLTARGTHRCVAPMLSGVVSGDFRDLADGGEKGELWSRFRHARHSKNSRNAAPHVCTRTNARPRLTRKIATVANRDLWRHCLSPTYGPRTNPDCHPAPFFYDRRSAGRRNLRQWGLHKYRQVYTWPTIRHQLPTT